MDNVNGGLAFKATLDIDDFNVSAQAMERHIKQVSNTTIAESAMMEQSLQNMAQNGAKYIVSYLVGQGMGSLLQSIVTTRGQFQQLEIAFETMLRSGTKSKTLMDQLVETAAKTPFDLQGIASSTKQMLAYGSSVETVVDEIVMLGNVASGVGAPLGEIAYLYGTLRAQGRAYAVDIRQFAGRGIPIYEELAKVIGVSKDEVSALITEGKVGFTEVEQAFKNMTSSSGVYYNLMQEQSKSLTGMISNLGDAWDSALNKIGTDNQDLFASGIQGAISLVENYDEILRIIQAITVAYGSYKAAIVLNTLATKGYTGVALLDNTARQAKIALLKIDAQLSGQVSAQTKAMTAAQEAHTISLQKQLTAEEHANLVKSLRIATIQQLLTAQQQEYLSNLNLTASSANYEAVAMSVLSVEQRAALSKTDLSAKSAVYRAALEQEVIKKNQNQVSTLNAMRAEVSAAAAKVEASKQTAIATMQATEAARYEVYWAKQSGDATRIATAEKKLEGAQENQAIARKAALSAQTDFHTKKKALEAAAVRQSTVATTADTVAKATNATTTSMLTAITTKATLAMKTLWASMMSNPIGWVIGLVGALVSVLTLFRKEEEEATTFTGAFNDTMRDTYAQLNAYFAILKNSESGTKPYKDALSKINSLCEEHKVAILNENAALEEQIKKHDELIEAMERSSAAKIKAKYIEQEYLKLQEKQEEQQKKLIEAAQDAKYTAIEYAPMTTPEGVTTMAYQAVKHNSDALRGASEALWASVIDQTISSSKELSQLSGEAYTTAVDNLVTNQLNKIKDATQASDEEINAFREDLKEIITQVLSDSNACSVAVAKIEEEVKEMFGGEDIDPKPITESVDYVSMSFEELDKKAQDTQKEIDAINAKKVKVDADTSKLNELLSTLKEINSAVNQKTENLNTEAGINARIKQLKDERSNVEINSSKYKELTKTINSLESRLPKSNNNAAQKADELSRKQLEAERKLEEDRISVMSEGYEKRKAMLDLQHKQNLDRIDKEEKELEKARKDAGKGGLTDDQKAGFDERRSIENKSYTDAQNEIFDGEIEYKKKQYDLYFRWVRTMGEDVARSHFSELLKDGESYKEFVQNQINMLKEKQSNQGLTEGEGNYLISLNMQYNEITGAKTAMDAFKESVTSAISQAQNLSEKIQAIADAKDKITNGGSGLVGDDEKSEAALFVNEEDVKIQQEISQKLLDDFKDFDQKKQDIISNYNALRLSETAKNNEDLLKKINDGEKAALSALQAEQLQASTDWKNLFMNLDTLSAGEIQKLITNIENQISNSDLKLNPVDYQALLDSLNKAKDKVVELNPFLALGNAFNNYISATKKLKKAEEDNLSPEQIKALEQQTKTSAEQIVISIQSINQIVGAVGDSMSSLFSSFGNDDLAETISSVTDVLGGAGQTAMGVGQIMSGDLLGGITSVIGGVTSVIGAFNKMHDKKKEKQIQSLQDEVDKLSDAYDNLGDSIGRAYSTDKASMIEQQNELLKQENEKIRQQIQAEKDKKDTDWDRIKEWEKQIKENEKEIAENEKYNIIEAIMGTEIATAIDDFANAYADAWAKGEKAAGKSAETVKNLIRTAIIDQLKNKLEPEVQKLMQLMSDSFEDDGIIDAFEESQIEDYIKKLESISDEYLSQNEKWLKDDDETESQDPLTGAVRSMSEETGGVIAGRLNAFIINQSDQIVIMRSSLAYQAEIAANTRISAERLTGIETTLKRIESKDNSLLSRGIS